MRKLYENFHILHFQKRIVSVETICGNTVHILDSNVLLSENELFSSTQTILKVNARLIWYMKEWPTRQGNLVYLFELFAVQIVNMENV